MRRIPRTWTSWRDIRSRGTDNLAGGRPWSRTLVPRILLTPINRSFFFEPTAPAFSHVVYDLASKSYGIISIIENFINIFYRDTCLFSVFRFLSLAFYFIFLIFRTHILACLSRNSLSLVDVFDSFSCYNKKKSSFNNVNRNAQK